MPFKSKAQQRYMESDASPLSESQKREWEGATDFDKLPERSKNAAAKRRPRKKNLNAAAKYAEKD